MRAGTCATLLLMLRRVWPVVVVLGLTVASLQVAAAPPAAACSCASTDARSGLADADAAFVGRLESRPASSGDEWEEGVYRFSVERAVKGPLGETVEVVAGTSSSACGLEFLAEDTTVGLFLHLRPDGRYGASSCGMVAPEELIAAAEPLPEPDGDPPPALLVATRFGDARVIGLDRDGRVTGYGRGEGSGLKLAMCSGGERFVELGFTNGEGETPAFVAVRRLPDLALVSQIDAPAATGSTATQRVVNSLSCRRSDGSDVLLGAVEGPEEARVGSVVRVFDSGQLVVWRGRAEAVVISEVRNLAFLTARGPSGHSLDALDLEAGTTESLATITPTAGMFLGPFTPNADETLLAAVAYSPDPVGGRPSLIIVVDLSSERAEVRVAELGSAGVAGTVEWVDDDRFVFAPSGGNGDLTRVFDTQLRSTRAWPDWAGFSMAVDGHEVFLAGFDSVRSHSLESDDARTIWAAERVSLHDISSVASRAVEPPPLGDVTYVSAPDPSTTTTSPPSPAPGPHRAGASSVATPTALAASAIASVGLVLGLRRRRHRRASTSHGGPDGLLR